MSGDLRHKIGVDIINAHKLMTLYVVINEVESNPKVTASNGPIVAPTPQPKCKRFILGASFSRSPANNLVNNTLPPKSTAPPPIPCSSNAKNRYHRPTPRLSPLALETCVVLPLTYIGIIVVNIQCVRQQRKNKT